MNVIAYQLIVFTGLGALFNQFLQINKSKNSFKFFGESFFIGIFIVISVNNLSQLLKYNIQQNILFNIISLVSISTLIVLTYKNKNLIFNQFQNLKSKKLSPTNIITAMILLLIILHLYYIIKENQSIPLTPWDAWNSWIAKAKIWFYHGITEPLINRKVWLLSDAKLTNSIAHYPDGLPLLYLFNSGHYGWNETLLNGIYPAMFIAFLSAFYGNIKILSNHTYALASVMIITTIPFVNIHITLAGYADIWVACLLVLAFLNMQYFFNNPSTKTLIISVILVTTLVMFKLEAWIWAFILLTVTVLHLININYRKWVYLFIIAIIIIWYLIGGIEFSTPLGKVIFKPNLIKIPMMGSFNLSFKNTTTSWIEALYLSKNWNLLWYTLPIVLFLYFKTHNKQQMSMPATFLLFTTIFLFVLFYMTYASVFANDFSSSNRIVLHIAPLYVYFIVQVFYRYNSQKITNKD